MTKVPARDVSKLTDQDSLSTIELANVLGVTSSTVVSLIRAGLLRSFKPAARNYRIKVTDAKLYCREHDVSWPNPDVPGMLG